MKKTIFYGALLALLATALPLFSFGQAVSERLQGMQPVLDRVYAEMLPLCAKLIDVGRGLAGFGALWYIASRVWQQIARAEAIDFYPLLRPFALGLAIVLYPMVIGIMNGVLSPTVSATSGMVKDSNRAIERLLAQKETALKKTKKWQMYVGNQGPVTGRNGIAIPIPRIPTGRMRVFWRGLAMT